VGVPPPPGSTRRAVGSSGFAARLGLVEAPTEVEAQHAATVLRAVRLDHLREANPVGWDRPRAEANCWTAFALSSPPCRATYERAERARNSLRPTSHLRNASLHMTLPDALGSLEGVDGVANTDRPGGAPFSGAIVTSHHPTTIGPLHDFRVMHLPHCQTSCAEPPVRLTLTTARRAGERFREVLLVRERHANCRNASPVAAPPEAAWCRRRS
jgi:hypothetical protein